MLNPKALRSLTAVKVIRGVTIDFYKASLINRQTRKYKSKQIYSNVHEYTFFPYINRTNSSNTFTVHY